MNWNLFPLYLLAILAVAGVAASVLAFYAWRRRGIRAAISSVSEAVLVLDKANHVVDMNLAAQHLLGRSLPQIGRQRADLLLGTDLAFFNRPNLPFDAYLETTLTPAANGQTSTERVVEIRRSAPLNPKGHRHHHLLLLRDVTEARQAEASLRAQKQLYENLVTVARATAERPTLEETLRNALDVAATITEAEFGSLFLLDNAGLVTHSIIGLGKGLTHVTRANANVQHVLEKGLAGWVALHRQPALVADTNQDDRWLRIEGNHYAAGSALAVPILSGVALLGILTLTHPAPHHFTDDHTALLKSAADQMALAVRNAQIYEEQRRLADRQMTLYETLRAAGAYLEPEAVARAAVANIAQLTGWPAVALLLPDETGTKLVVQAAAGSLAAPIGTAIPINQDIAGRAMRLGQMQYVPNVADDPDYVAAHTAICTKLSVPLQRGERILGILDVGSDQPNSFSSDDTRLAVSLSEAIALALDNARSHTAMRQHAQAIADERSLLQSIIESSRDGIILVGPQGRLRVVNEPALRFLRLPGRAEDWSGRPLGEVLLALRRRAPDLFPVILNETRRVRQGTEPPGEGESELPPRILHWLHLPVTAGRVLLGRLLVLQDVTEQRSLEQLREDLTYTMVHDLRSPLTGILGSVEFIDRSLTDQLSPDQRQVLDVARSNTQRMLKLVNAILDISRLESGRLPLEQTPISLPDFIADALRAHQPLALQKGLHLQSDLAPHLPLAWADKGLFERVLQNLLGNAIKFTPPGGRVKVTATLDRLDRPRLLVAVSDTGPGIPPDLQERIFDRFTTGRREESGTGLGLAFCKMVVEAHHQRLWVESHPGQGATFTFTLPTMPEIDD